MTGAEAVAELPDKIKIAGFDFSIRIWSPAESTDARRYGECSSFLQKISIQENMPTPMKAVDTVIHEILHAIFWAYNIHDEDEEERIVGTLGSAWTQVYRDNPWLIDWIGKALA